MSTLLAEAPALAQAPAEALSAWARRARVEARDETLRHQLRADQHVRAAVARAIRLGADATDAPAAAALGLEDWVALLANLVVGDDAECSACRALHADGALEPFFRLCEASTEREALLPLGKLQMVCMIALGNFARQLGTILSDDESTPAAGASATASGQAEPVLPPLTEGEQELEAAIATATLLRACLIPLCQASHRPVRENALRNIEEFCSRSAVLKDLFSDLFSEPAATILPLIAATLEDPARRPQAVSLLRVYCDNLAVSAKEIERLISFGIVANLSSAALVKQDTPESQDTALAVLTDMAKVVLSPQGAPALEDADFMRRTELLRSGGALDLCLEWLAARDAETGEGGLERCTSVAQLLSYLAINVSVAEEPSSFEKLATVLLATVANESAEINLLIAELRTGGPTATPELDAERRAKILPHARLRLGLLGTLNSLAASSRSNCAYLLDKSAQAQGEGSSDASEDNPGGIVAQCVDLVDKSFDFDVEACRYAINILRNLSLDPDHQLMVLACTGQHRFGRLMSKVASTSRDPNSAGLAAALLRIYASSRRHDTLVNLVDADAARALVGVELQHLGPFAHVEIARALSHMLATVGESADADPDLRQVLMTSQTILLILFLLQSEQPVLHAEALDALLLCSADLFDLAGVETLKLQVAASSAEGGSGAVSTSSAQPGRSQQPKTIGQTLVQRLEALATRGGESDAHASVATQAAQLAARLKRA